MEVEVEALPALLRVSTALLVTAPPQPGCVRLPARQVDEQAHSSSDDACSADRVVLGCAYDHVQRARAGLGALISWWLHTPTIIRTSYVRVCACLCSNILYEFCTATYLLVVSCNYTTSQTASQPITTA